MAQARIAIHKQLGSILQCSGIYRSKSWGYQSSHEFLNQAIEIQTRYTAQQCLNILKQIESALGRFPKKTNLYEDRCIDLDLLYFNNDVILLPNLNIPHPQISKRAFVLKPLTDLIPEFKDPLTKLRVKTMLQKNKGKNQISLYSNGSPKLVSIMGPIGSGKTTLAKALVKNLNARFIQERYTKNTNLHLFYKGNTSKAFAMETWFLNEHKKQFDRKRFKKPNQLSISDYYLSQNYLFAKQNLSAKDFKLFEKKYHRTAQACMIPDYIIYLTCSASKSLYILSNSWRQEMKILILFVIFTYKRVSTELTINVA